MGKPDFVRNYPFKTPLPIAYDCVKSSQRLTSGAHFPSDERLALWATSSKSLINRVDTVAMNVLQQTIHPVEFTPELQNKEE
jgi:hypothetical protein